MSSTKTIKGPKSVSLIQSVASAKDKKLREAGNRWLAMLSGGVMWLFRPFFSGLQITAESKRASPQKAKGIYVSKPLPQAITFRNFKNDTGSNKYISIFKDVR